MGPGDLTPPGKTVNSGKTRMKRLLVLGAAALILSGCAKPAAQTETASASAPTTAAPSIAGIPAGDYTTDPAHSSLTFEVDHMSFSNYTSRFATFEAHLKLDPAHPDQASVTATIDPQSLALNTPPAGFHDQLMGKDVFDAKAFPSITFASTGVELTGANTARVTGNLTLHGVTKPVTLDATFNGGYPGFDMDPHARIGFSLTGKLKRSDFGMGFGIPAPGTTMGVGDTVTFQIETELSGPPFVRKS